MDSSVDDDLEAAPVDGRVLRELLVQMVGMCTVDSPHGWQQRVSIHGLASQCGDDGHACTAGEPWLRDIYRAELMQSLARGVVVELKRDQLSAKFVDVVHDAALLSGMTRRAGSRLFSEQLLQELSTGVEPAMRERLVASSVRPLGGRGAGFARVVFEHAAEHGLRDTVFVEKLRDSILHDFAEGGLTDPATVAGGQEFTAIFTDAFMSARIDSDAVSNPQEPDSSPAARTRRARV
jgi:hypothetical protein